MLAVVMSAGFLVVSASPSQAVDTALMDARIGSVRLTPNGLVRVSIQYRCPDGYQGVPTESFFYVSNQLDGGHGTFDQTFGEAIVCDGDTQTLVRSFAHEEVEGQAWPWERHLNASVLLTVSRPDPEPRTLYAEQENTFSMHGQAKASRPAEMRIMRARKIARKTFVVGMSYRCPTGWSVPGGDNDWAELAINQDDPSDGSYVNYGVPLAEQIVCDGTTRALVTRIEDHRLSLRLPIELRALLIVMNPERRWHISSSDGVPVLLA